MENVSSEELAKRIRLHALSMTYKAKSSHIASCFSIADVLAVLYKDTLKISPCRSKNNSDKFVLSKGHAAAALYSVLSEIGFFPTSLLDSFSQDGSHLTGHVSHLVPGISVSTGSLGHGLPIACGIAIAEKRKRTENRVFVILGDGECAEGTTWEAALFANQHKLDNLTVIIDYNKLQGYGRVENILNLDSLELKWSSFGWSVRKINGHNHQEIRDVLNKIPLQTGKPTCIISDSIKGRGVSFMEDKLLWHYRSPNDEEYILAKKELEAR